MKLLKHIFVYFKTSNITTDIILLYVGRRAPAMLGNFLAKDHFYERWCNIRSLYYTIKKLTPSPLEAAYANMLWKTRVYLMAKSTF